jgi:hypothetical protein
MEKEIDRIMTENETLTNDRIEHEYQLRDQRRQLQIESRDFLECESTLEKTSEKLQLDISQLEKTNMQLKEYEEKYRQQEEEQ